MTVVYKEAPANICASCSGNTGGAGVILHYWA